MILRGKVHEGQIIFPEAVALPEGTEVVVSIEPIAEQSPSTPAQSVEEFLSQPFFGMYADREDMKDSVAWVRKEREKWHHRAQRQD
jgi:hypothetical protein